MAGAGYRNWTAGDIPTATQFDTFLQEQTVMVFASTAARDTALSVPKSEGMYAYAVDINTLHFYTGSVWTVVHEPIQTWNVTSITQGVAVACTTTYGWYQRSHGVWRGQLAVTLSAAGTPGSGIVVATPFTLASLHGIGGTFTYQDVSVPSTGSGSVHPLTTTTMQFIRGLGEGLGASGSPTTAESGDILRITAVGTY